ncbi:MAG TPA: DNA methyltransferase [Alphaproteobacteria bacterium]|nr:DNA methyltransferase [Alphaproteobacteria bacterium]
MHIILLSGENLKLARLECESLLGLENTILDGNMLFCTIPTEKMAVVNRLACTKKVFEVMYSTIRQNLGSSLESYPWINVYEKSFRIRINSSEHYDERHYSGFVWKSLEKSTRPKVDLKNPDLMIEIFIEKDKAIVTRVLYQNFESFEHRKAHLRPKLHPTTMHPKMARALINILNPDQKSKVIDPFCGACGILTEAGLLGIKFEGYDIDKQILEDAKQNMTLYEINPKHYNLRIKDATKVKGLKNVVTDLPYGKSSKKSHELITLYAKFLKNISGRSVVVMPHFMPYKELLKKNLSKTLVVTHIIDHYVHKSLTRKIIVIDVAGKIKKTKEAIKTKKKTTSSLIKKKSSKKHQIKSTNKSSKSKIKSIKKSNKISQKIKHRKTPLKSNKNR